MVTDVSAMFVLRMHFLMPDGAISKTLFCSSTDNVLRGSMKNDSARNYLCNIKIIHRLENSAYSLRASATIVISDIPFKKTRTSPLSVSGYFLSMI